METRFIANNSILGKLDDDCKDLFQNLKAECADDTFPWVFKGKACADINVGDLLPKKQKPEAGTEKPPKPCTETEDGEVSTHSFVLNFWTPI